VLRVDHERWGQTLADLRRLALTAPHARSRERFLALHYIAQGTCATRVAARTGRHTQTVMGWLHGYNECGPELSIGIERGPPIGVQKGPPWWVWIGAARRPGAVGVGATGNAAQA